MNLKASISAGYGLLRSLWLYRRPGRQRALRRFYRPFVGPGELVFDIGAHVGDRTRAFAGLGARVAAFEPNPALAARLQRALAGHAAIEVIETAVGEAPGRATLHVSSATPTVSSLNAAWTEQVAARNAGFADVRWDRPVEVPVTTLARLIERHGEPVFCKIDVEGHEARVLAGLDRPLAALSFEFVHGMLDGARDCVDRLAELGEYEYNAVEGERRRFLWRQWRSAAGVRDWLDAGADALASGDLYARRVRLRTVA
jgi:FkbM family methyltransferase